MVKFQKLEDFRSQGIKKAEAKVKYDEQVIKAKEALDALKIQADEVLTLEITTGTDKTAVKADIKAKIEQAEKDVQMAEETSQRARQIIDEQPNELNAADVVSAWVNEYVPAIHAEHLPSIQARMKQGQALILSAYLDFNKLRNEYQALTNDIGQLNKVAFEAGQQPFTYSIQNPFGESMITGLNTSKLAEQLSHVGKGYSMPNDVEYLDKPLEAPVKEGN